MTLPTETGQALEALLMERDLRDMPRTRSLARRAVVHILAALVEGRDLETYAQIKCGFWYKVYIFTPVGAWKCDTNGAHRDPTTFARAVIRAQDLRRVPLSAVMENWQAAGLHEARRTMDALLLRTWQSYERRQLQKGA
jgi:hypothetical protein